MSVDSHIVDIQAVDSISDVNRFYQRVIIDTIHHETFITPPAVLVLHHVQVNYTFSRDLDKQDMLRYLKAEHKELITGFKEKL